MLSLVFFRTDLRRRFSISWAAYNRSLGNGTMWNGGSGGSESCSFTVTSGGRFAVYVFALSNADSYGTVTVGIRHDSLYSCRVVERRLVERDTDGNGAV